MRLCWGVIYCMYTGGRYWIAFKWQGDKFLVWGFGGLRVTWYLTCERACEESHTRKSSILKRWLAGVVTWFCAVHMNAINRSRISTAFTAWPEMSGVPLHWRKRKSSNGDEEMERDKQRVLQFKQVWEQLSLQNSCILKSATYLRKI